MLKILKILGNIFPPGGQRFKYFDIRKLKSDISILKLSSNIENVNYPQQHIFPKLFLPFMIQNMRFQMLMLMLFGTSVASRRVSLFETMKCNSRADPCWSAAGKKKSVLWVISSLSCSLDKYMFQTKQIHFAKEKCCMGDFLHLLWRTSSGSG